MFEGMCSCNEGDVIEEETVVEPPPSPMVPAGNPKEAKNEQVYLGFKRELANRGIKLVKYGEYGLQCTLKCDHGFKTLTCSWKDGKREETVKIADITAVRKATQADPTTPGLSGTEVLRGKYGMHVAYKNQAFSFIFGPETSPTKTLDFKAETDVACQTLVTCFRLLIREARG